MTSKPQKLNDSHFKQLRDALLSAFPTEDTLKQMVRFELDENLDEIAGGQNLSEKVFNLIEWAKAQGRTEELINGARNNNPVLQQLDQDCYKQAIGYEE